MKEHLAIAFSEKELKGLEKYAEQNIPKNEKITAIFYSPSPAQTALGFKSERIEVKNPNHFLKKEEFQEIEKQIAFIARNWYRLDKQFEQQATFQGINLGFIQESEISYFFRRTFYLVKSLLNAAEKLKPKTIIVNKAGQGKQYTEAIAKTKGLKFVYASLSQEQGYMKYPNLRTKKLSEIKQKLPKVLKNVLPANKKGKKTVFVRDRDRLGNLKQQLKADSSLNVVSLDEFLLSKLLNPAKACQFILGKKAMRKKLKKEFEAYKSTKSFAKGFCFEGIDFSKILAGQLNQVSERDWPEFTFLIKELGKFFEKHKPDVLVLWEDWVPFERISTMLAKKHGAKSIVLQHGVFEPILKTGDWVNGFVPLTADKIAVWGEKYRQTITSHGVPESKVAITGAPQFDPIKKRSFNTKQTRKKLGLKPNEKLIMLASNWLIDKSELETIVKSVQSLKNTEKRLVVKAHPVESPAQYSWMQPEAIVVQNFDLYELLNAADVVIVKQSTVGLEAMLFGKPVIVFEEQWTPENAYDSIKAVTKAENRQELEKALASALSGDNREKQQKEIEKAVYDFAFKQDGKATERAVNLIKEMADSKQQGSFLP